MHEQQIVHHDLKPQNLILHKSDDDVHVIDFGLATKIPAGRKLYLRCGSPGYVAPELLKLEGYDT